MAEDICRVKEEKDSSCSKPTAAPGTGPSDNDSSDQPHEQPSTNIQIIRDDINNEQHSSSQTRMSENQQNHGEATSDTSNDDARRDAGGDDGRASQCRLRHADSEQPNELTNGFAYSVCQDISNETAGSNDHDNQHDNSKAIWTDEHQKLTDYAASIEKVKDVS